MTFMSENLEVDFDSSTSLKNLKKVLQLVRIKYDEKCSQCELQVKKQRHATEKAEIRAIYSEDKAKFYEDQNKLLLYYWQGQCEKKDHSIKFLNSKLLELQKDSSNSSIQHEYECLKDRHEELTRRWTRSETRKKNLEKNIQNVEKNIEENIDVEKNIEENTEKNLEKEKKEKEIIETSEYTHKCIWKDQLEIRVSQLERLSSTFDTIYSEHNKMADNLEGVENKFNSLRAKYANLKLEYFKTSKLLKSKEKFSLETNENFSDLLKITNDSIDALLEEITQ